MKPRVIYLLAVIIGCFPSSLLSKIKNSSIMPPDTIPPLQAAFEGTWKYQDDSTIFIVQIKLLHSRITTYRDGSKDTIYVIYGDYLLSKNGKIIENNLDNLKNFAPYDKYDDINWEKVWDNNGYTPPIRGSSITGDISGQVSFTDMTTKRTPYGYRRVGLGVDRSDAFNNRLYWDLNDIIIYELFECAISDAVYAEWEKQQKGKVFAVPEKCTLTRISHDPYYEVDIE